MKVQTLVQGALAVTGLALVAPSADATTITIEPDNYVGVIGDVAPGARMSAFRRNSTGTGFVFHRVHSVDVGTWAPTGTRVFGKKPQSAAEPSYHWNDLASAFQCESGISCLDNFYVFRVDFDIPTNRASVQTIFGEYAQDGMELHAYNSAGTRILRCRMDGWNPATDVTGVVDPPRYMVPAPLIGAVCGGTVAVKNCAILGPVPSGCDFAVKLSVARAASDIAYIEFGGGYATGTYSLVDKLQYWIP